MTDHATVTQAEVDAAKEAIRKLTEGGCGFQEAVYHLVQRKGISFQRAPALVEFSELIAGEKLVRL